MRYHFFLDETGDHGLSYIDKDFPIFLLLGVLISDAEYARVTKAMNVFKETFFRSNTVVLHSRDIRKCQNEFQVLFDHNLKSVFYTQLNKILQEATFKILGAGVNKHDHIKKYGKLAKNPYALSLSFMLERLVFCTDDIADCATVDMVIERRGKLEDEKLELYYKEVTQRRGTYYVAPERFRDRISSFGFAHKRDNSVGLQIADLCAYPIARKILAPEVVQPSYDIIKDKIRTMHKNDGGIGIKMFP